MSAASTDGRALATRLAGDRILPDLPSPAQTPSLNVDRAMRDNAEIDRLMRRCGMTPQPGFYEPATPLPDGRWSVDPSTLMLLLATYERATS